MPIFRKFTVPLVCNLLLNSWLFAANSRKTGTVLPRCVPPRTTPNRGSSSRVVHGFLPLATLVHPRTFAPQLTHGGSHTTLAAAPKSGSFVLSASLTSPPPFRVEGSATAPQAHFLPSPLQHKPLLAASISPISTVGYNRPMLLFTSRTTIRPVNAGNRFTIGWSTSHQNPPIHDGVPL